MTRRAVSRGYTAVELLMALAVFAIGVTGIIAMQKVTVVSNQHAKNLAIATRIADAWAGQLVADSAVWNSPSPANPTSDLPETVWLDQVDSRGNAWFQPDYNTTRAFGPAFDALGNPLDPAAQGVQFCTHLRLSWLYQQNSGNGLIRAEIRVFWLREGQPSVDNQSLCSAGNNSAQLIGTSITNYHFVYQTTAIGQQISS